MKNIKDFSRTLVDDMLSSSFDDFQFDKEKSVAFMRRLYSDILNNKKVTIVGDYDVDGFFSAIALETYLKLFESRIKNKPYDMSNIQVVFSSRTDGYEMPYEKILKLQKDGVVVFLDTGSSYDYINKETKNIYVIDHHPIEKNLIESENIFNPNPNGSLSTSTGRIVYEIANAFESELKKYFIERGVKIKEHDAMSYIKALAGITIVSDMANLNEHQNRIFLKESLEILSNNKDKFTWLSSIHSKDISSTDLSFNLINTINSFSRMGVDLGEVKDLFRIGIKGEKLVRITSSQKADELLAQMTKVHEQRKKLTADLEKNIESTILSENLFSSGGDLLCFKVDNNFSGINGLLAQYALNRTNKPSVVLSYDANRELYVGSARGFGVKSLLSYVVNKNNYEKSINVGGHQMACGLTVKAEAIEDFLKDTKNILFEDVNITEKPEFEDICFKSECLADFQEACLSYENKAGGVKRSQRYYAIINNYKNNGIVEKNNGWFYSLISDNTGVAGVYFKEGDIEKIKGNKPIVLEIDTLKEGIGTFFIQNKTFKDNNIEQTFTTEQALNDNVTQLQNGVKI